MLASNLHSWQPEGTWLSADGTISNSAQGGVLAAGVFVYWHTHLMEFWGPPSTIERKETPEELLFNIEPQMRVIDCLITGIVASIFAGCLLGWWYGLGLGSVAALGMGWYGSSTHKMIVLRVTREYIQVSGSTRQKRLSWSQIIRLDYAADNEDSPSGLTAKTGRLTSEMLVTAVSRDQARGIISAIHQHFPRLVMADEPPGLLETLFHREKAAPHELSPQDKDRTTLLR